MFEIVYNALHGPLFTSKVLRIKTRLLFKTWMNSCSTYTLSTSLKQNMQNVKPVAVLSTLDHI